MIMRQCKDKGHISHPQEKPQSRSTGGGGERGQDGYITLGGWGGCLPNLDHICVSAYPEWNKVYRVLDIMDSKIGLVLAR